MSDTNQKLIDAYERFAEKTKEFLAESREKTSETFEHAMDQARENMEKAGEISRSESDRLKAFLKRDMEQTAQDFKNAGEKAQASLNPHNLKSGFFNLVGYVAKNSSQLMESLAEWAENEVVLHTGEVTGPAVLTCRSCDEVLHFKESGRVPPCPKCHKTEFQRTG